MALNDLFEMTKADRYTADGCEELNKAREAATEDARRTYKNGEISETTGLMKTPNGWVPPTETKFGKVKQNKEGQWGVQTKQGKGSDFLKHKSEKEAKRALSNYTRGYNTTERSKQDPHSDYARQQKQWNKETEKIRKNNNAERRAEHASHFQENKTAEIDVKSLKEGQVLKNKEGTELKIDYIGPHAINYSVGGASFQATPNQMKAALEANGYTSTGSTESKPERYDYRSALEKGPKDAFAFEGTVTHSIPMSAEDKEQLANIKSFMKEEKTDYKDAIKSVATGLVNGNKLHGDWYPEREESVLKIAKAVGLEDELKNYIAANHKGYDFGYSEDAAPRQLTGDTRLHLSQVKDKVYQIGEISEKTGLQKTANGWVKPKSGKTAGAKKDDAEEWYEKEREYVDKHGAPAGTTKPESAEEWLEREYKAAGERESKPAAPRRESVSAGRMQKDLDGNFWSRPEDFKEDITSRGWDVDEMTNEYAVISNEAGSQYEVRFDDHSDDGDLTVKRFKALQIDEDDDDDSLEDSAPRVLTGDCKIRVRK